MLSVVILGSPKYLQSLSFCDEVIVVPPHPISDFSAVRNRALQHAKGDWVLFIDADEEISPKLAQEIKKRLLEDKNINGYLFKRRDYFLRKELKHGETAKVKLLRLARKNSGLWQGRVHEKWQVKGRIKELSQPLLHKRKLTLVQFLDKLNFYSDIRAQELYQQKAKTNLLLIFLYPSFKFCQNYFCRLGLLDGIPGFIMAAMMSLHSFMVRSKLWVMNKNNGRETFREKTWQKYAV